MRGFKVRKVGIHVIRLKLRSVALWVMLGAFVFLAYSYIAGRMAGASIEAMSWVVANKVIVIDPGHGGVDPGAIGAGGTYEKDLTLQIAKRLRQTLSRAGALVVLTREDDVDLGSPGLSLSQRKKEDLQKRVAFTKEQNAELYLNIQANSYGNCRGAQVFYDPKSVEGTKLAKTIQAELKRMLGITYREATKIDAYVLRNLDIPAAMVEVGFLSNPQEEKLLNDPYYQEKLVWAIYAGTVKYLAELNNDKPILQQ
jgi:N-acetylmuramoyl-L-alanine amidase